MENNDFSIQNEAENTTSINNEMGTDTMNNSTTTNPKDVGDSQTSDSSSAETKKKSGLSVTSFILGIASVVCCPLGVLTGLAGLIFGIISRVKKQGKKGLSIFGIILSAFGIILSIIVLIVMIIMIIASVSAVQTVKNYNSSHPSALSNIEIVGDAIKNVDFDEVDLTDPDSLAKAMGEAALETAVDSIGEKINSEEGMTINIQGIEVRVWTNEDGEKMIEADGEEKSLSDFCEETGIPEELIDSVLNGDIDVEMLEKILGMTSGTEEVSTEDLEELLDMFAQ